MCVEVDDEVLVLDVAVHDAGALDRRQRVDHVGEPLATRGRLEQCAVRRYVVKQVLQPHHRCKKRPNKNKKR